MHLLKIRALASVVSPSRAGGSAIPRATRTLKYLVQPGAVDHSARFPITNNRNGDAHRQLFEKTWTLSGARPLEKLKLSLPGVTFISVDDGDDDDGLKRDQVAKIRVTSDTVQALAGISVEAAIPHRTLLNFSSSARTPSHGNLLTEILLPRGTSGLLRNLTASGQGLVVIEDGVFAMHGRPDQVIKLAATQGSKIAIKAARDVEVSRLQIAAARHSKVFFQTPALRAHDEVKIASVGGSEVHFQSQNDFDSPLLNLAIAGSGTFSVHAHTFIVEEATSAIAGSGRIVLGSWYDTVSKSVASSACRSHNIAIFGAGDVDCADMMTDRVAVAVAGQGSLALGRIQVLKMWTWGATKAACFDGLPSAIFGNSLQNRSIVTMMQKEDRDARKQRRDLENQELQNFWRSIPTRESALDAANQSALTGAQSEWWWQW